MQKTLTVLVSWYFGAASGRSINSTGRECYDFLLTPGYIYIRRKRRSQLRAPMHGPEEMNLFQTRHLCRHIRVERRAGAYDGDKHVVGDRAVGYRQEIQRGTWLVQTRDGELPHELCMAILET